MANETFPASRSLYSASNYAAITPSDTVNLPQITRAIRVGGYGDVVAVTANDIAVTFKSCSAGEVLLIEAKRVDATGTSADMNLVAYY